MRKAANSSVAHLKALAWEERAKNFVLANARVKRCGQPPATLFTTKCFQQCTTSAHGSDCTLRRYSPEARQQSLRGSQWIVGKPYLIGLRKGWPSSRDSLPSCCV